MKLTGRKMRDGRPCARRLGHAFTTLSRQPSSNVIRHEELANGSRRARRSPNASTDSGTNRRFSTAICISKVARLTTMAGCEPASRRSSGVSTRWYIRTTARFRSATACQICSTPTAYSACDTTSLRP